jgi:hypothetical protein
MNKAFILQLKESNTFFLYGSLVQLFKEHGDVVLKKIRTLRDIDFDVEDYEDNNVVIMQRTIIRSKHREN